MTRTKYIEFIKDKLFELFPNLSDCSFSYDECSDTYFIYIPSKSLFVTDEFISFNAESTLKYYDFSFEGTLAFISDITHMEYLEFQQFKNPTLNISDWLNNLQSFPIKSEDIELFNILITSSNYFGDQDKFASDFSGESNYALAA